jgi:hypothetical protein
MEGPFETAAPYDAPPDDADRWQAPMQQQAVTQRLEQQQQMRRAEGLAEAPVQATPEQVKREFERALAWVKDYEPDRLW